MSVQDVIPAVKDGDAAHPIPTEWRPTLRAIVAALRQGDIALTGLNSVAPTDSLTQDQIKWYLGEYGETLDELPDETWKSSVSQWAGTHWDVFVDLWTRESGKSDLVLTVRVFELDSGAYRMEVDTVHVP